MALICTRRHWTCTATGYSTAWGWGWIDYIPFNRRFRPEVVEGRRFPKIRVDCCNREISEVTEESLRRDMAPCPGCGAFRSYEVIERPE